MVRSIDLDGQSDEDLMRLLEEILNRLPAQELRKVRDTAETKRLEKLEEAKIAVLEEMRGKLEGLGLTLNDVIPQYREKGEAGRQKRNVGRVLPVKYRGTNGETWSGRGHIPQWLRALEDEGHKRDEFLVNAEE